MPLQVAPASIPPCGEVARCVGQAFVQQWAQSLTAGIVLGMEELENRAKLRIISQLQLRPLILKAFRVANFEC
jgi:hypothetical protein